MITERFQAITSVLASSLLAAVLLLAQIVSVVAQEPITHEDVWLMKRLGTPALSPDGSWAIFSVTKPSYEPDGQVSDLWLVATDGSTEARRLTATRGSESGVEWSPDGMRIAFSARRESDEASQIYLLDMTGPGEAKRLTSLSTGARNPVWSPDGTSLAFESSVYPGAVDDEANQQEARSREARRYDASVYDGFPIRNSDHWLDDKQTHLFVVSVEAAGQPRDLLAGSELVSKPGYAASSLQAVWAPDEQSLVFSATINRDEAARAVVRYHLFQVSATGGEPQQLTASDASFDGPVFSHDGQSLYSTMEPVTEYIYNATRIARFGWPELGDPEILTESFDRSVSGLALSADGETFYVLADDAGRTRVYSLPSEGGTVTALDETSRGVYAGIATPSQRGSTSLVARWEHASHPAEIVRIDPRTGTHELLTAFNVEAAAGIDWQPFREFWFTSSKGRRIHTWMALPPRFDETKKYPLILSVHGGPHSSSKDAGSVRWSPHLLASPGYVVLRTDYSGSTGYGEEFSQHIHGDPIVTPGEELLEAADEAIRLFDFIDGTRMAATGASYGGHMVNWFEGTSDRFKCLVGHAGLMNMEVQYATSDNVYYREVNNLGPVWEQGEIWRVHNPVRYAANFKTPMLLTTGERDFRVPINNALEAWTLLKRLQVPSRLIVFHQGAHQITRPHDAKFFWEQVHQWLAEYLSN